MDELSQLGELPGDWEEIRLDLIESHAQLISAYTESSRHLKQQGDLTFKPSTSKGKDEVEFLPTNLHVQRMWVSQYYGILIIHQTLDLRDPHKMKTLWFISMRPIFIIIYYYHHYFYMLQNNMF